MIYSVYLSFGSNLSSKFGSPVDNIKQAYLELLKYGFKIKKKSSFYKSVAYPNANDPEFINSVAHIICHLEVEQLLKIILKIEKKFGRIRNKKNEPRILDVDIIDFNTKKLSIKNGNLNLKIPHEHLERRLFVLHPLKEINPNWHSPINGKKISLIIAKNKINKDNKITKL